MRAVVTVLGSRHAVPAAIAGRSRFRRNSCIASSYTDLEPSPSSRSPRIGRSDMRLVLFEEMLSGRPQAPLGALVRGWTGMAAGLKKAMSEIDYTTSG
jgi:hypothetical protein